MKGENLNNLFILWTIVEIFLINFFLFWPTFVLTQQRIFDRIFLFQNILQNGQNFPLKKFNAGGGTKRDYICHF
jgi:hypothetical protein